MTTIAARSAEHLIPSIYGIESGGALRSLTALVAGFVAAAVLFQISMAVLFLAMYGIPLGLPAVEPGATYYALNLVMSLMSAIAGGYVAARLAGRKPVSHGAALGIALAILAYTGFSKPASSWPAWYPVILGITAVLGTTTGGVLGAARRTPPA